MGRQLIFTAGMGNKISQIGEMVESIFQGVSVIAHSKLVYNVMVYYTSRKLLCFQFKSPSLLHKVCCKEVLRLVNFERQ
jgi:hypothetical protein